MSVDDKYTVDTYICVAIIQSKVRFCPKVTDAIESMFHRISLLSDPLSPP